MFQGVLTENIIQTRKCALKRVLGKGKREGREGTKEGREGKGKEEGKGGEGEFASLALGGIDAPAPLQVLVGLAGDVT